MHDFSRKNWHYHNWQKWHKTIEDARQWNARLEEFRVASECQKYIQAAKSMDDIITDGVKRGLTMAEIRYHVRMMLEEHGFVPKKSRLWSEDWIDQHVHEYRVAAKRKSIGL